MYKAVVNKVNINEYLVTMLNMLCVAYLVESIVIMAIAGNDDYFEEKLQEVNFNEVTINEEWAMNNHYKQIYELQRDIAKIDNEINREQDFVKKTNLQEKKMKQPDMMVH